MGIFQPPPYKKHQQKEAFRVFWWLRGEKYSCQCQGTWVRSLGQEDLTCSRTTKLMYHNYRACALEPGSCKYQSPCTLPPVPHHKRSRCNKKSVHCNQDPAQPKTNKQNQCFRTVVLEKTFESPMDSKEIQPDNPKANQP